MLIDQNSVKSYNYSQAILTLEHNFPQGTSHKALVSVTLLLETLKSSDTSIGEWVNVTGPIMAPPPDKNMSPSVTYVQAINLWSAGPVKLHEYETALTDRLRYKGP